VGGTWGACPCPLLIREKTFKEGSMGKTEGEKGIKKGANVD